MMKINRKPTSVGEILTLEFLEPFGLTQVALGKLMSVDTRHINELCNNKRAITADTALMLARVFGSSAEFWLNIQQANDLWETLHNEKSMSRVKKATPLIELA